MHPQQEGQNSKFENVSNVEICDDGKIKIKYKAQVHKLHNIIQF